jgi:hypothetical protein
MNSISIAPQCSAGVGDVRDAVEFLLSDKEQSISEAVLTVDAGATA